MGFRHWLWVQLSDRTFGVLSDTRYIQFRRGKGTLPEVLPGEVRIVEIVLDLDGVGEVLHVDYRRFPVLANAFRDPAWIEWEFDLIRTVVGSAMSPRPNPAERRWADRQMRLAFQWSPTADEGRAIADAVSRRAKRSLLGGRPLRLVVPTS